MPQRFEIRDSSGQVYNRVTRPAAVFDYKLGILHKIGEYEDMLPYYEFMCKAYKDGGYPEMAEDLVVMDLPANQDEIDKVFQISDYIGTLYIHMKDKLN